VSAARTQAIALPVAFACALAASAAIPSVSENARLVESFLGTAAALLVWAAALFAHAKARHRNLAIELSLRKQHYVQACAQGSVMLYWGWYWREVYHSAPLLLAQLLFAYAFDALLTWSRRSTYALGFGPFPIVFSINLFLWFKPDWFYLQLLMVAVGFACKEFVRWNKDGRRAHIFNPSSIALALFSVALIATGTTWHTRAPDIATTLLRAPGIYTFIFVASLAGQYLFGVTTMTTSAVVALYLFGLVWFGITGTFTFGNSYVPIAVFLGMHLLFTDPSTAPRTELGRIVFGVLYAAGVFLFFVVLDAAHLPAIYDKLLPVPILNLAAPGIDRAARSRFLARFDPASVGAHFPPRQRHLAYIVLWTASFVAMSAAHAWDRPPGHL
jgi:hypothetical protein